MALTDVFKTFHLNAEECTFFSSAHEKLSRIDHILGHKSNLTKLKKIDIISSIFSDHNAMRLDNNHACAHTHTHTNTHTHTHTCKKQKHM